MTEVGAAAVAGDLDARLGRLAVIHGRIEGLLAHRPPEAGPAGSRLELVAGVEELGTAADADKRSLEVAAGILAREGLLRGLHPRDHELLGRQQLPPFFIKFFAAETRPFRDREELRP